MCSMTRLNPPVEVEVPALANVRVILRWACYDCHSNETVWPWYSQVAPFSWLVVRDVRKGRDELNFSTWNRITAKQQVQKLKQSWKEVAKGDMPPWFYVTFHSDEKYTNRSLFRRERYSSEAFIA